VVATGLAGTAALVGLVAVELRRREPMLDLRLLGDRLFRTVNAASFPAYGSFLGVLFVMPLFLQNARGLSATESGLTTFTEALGVIAASQVASRLYPRVGPRRLMVGGLTGTAAVTASLALIGLDTDIWLVRLAMFALGLGMGFMIMAQQAAAFAQISPGDTANASAIYTMLRQASAAVGVAVLATVLTSLLPSAGSDAPPADQLGAYRAAFLVAAGLTALAAVIAHTVRDQDAAATMAPRRDGHPPDEALHDVAVADP
jgi:MFS family permease